MSNRYRFAIVGAGPAGLSAAARAAFHNQQSSAQSLPNHILLESFNKPAQTIQKYQKGKFVMAEPGYLKLRSDFEFKAGTRESILENWSQSITSCDINIQYGAKVEQIDGVKGDFRIRLKNGSTIEAENIIIAIGLEGNPRKLGVEGEDLPCVDYSLDDADEFEEQTIIVVGAGDSAIENALALAKNNRVILLNRRDEFSRAKQGNLNAILAANNDPDVSLSIYYNATVDKIFEEGEGKYLVQVNTDNGKQSLVVNKVIARLGAIPPRRFLESLGIEFPNEKPNAIPELSGQYETNVPGIFIIGSLAGYPLIKQAMNQGYDVIEFILGNNIKPADHELLELQFKLLPFVKGVEELVDLFQKRIPMFRKMNGLQFRELIIESNVMVSLDDGEMYNSALAKAQSLEEQFRDDDNAPRFTKIIRVGDLIFKQGDFSSTFFTVVEGEVFLGEKTSESKKPLQRGEFFGENSLLSGRPREFNAVAGKNCILIETPRRTMLKLMNSNEDVKNGIEYIFTARALQKHLAPTLSTQQLSEAVQHSKQNHYKAGEVLFNQGETGSSLHIIRRGSVTLTRQVGDSDIVIAQYQTGKIVGEFSLMGDANRRETARASVYTETIEIDKALFFNLLSKDNSAIEVLQNNAATKALQHSSMEARPEVGAVTEFLMNEGLGEATNCLIIDESLCIGCDNCEKACAETHGGISRLNREEGGSFAQVHIPIACRHCEQPHCMKDCPPDAIQRSPGGEVFINDSCIGCGNCVTNCPYDVIELAYDAPPKPGFWSWLFLGRGSGPGEEPDYKPNQKALDKGKKAVKCDACLNVPSGPACVTSCPTGAAARMSPETFIKVLEGK